MKKKGIKKGSAYGFRTKNQIKTNSKRENGSLEGYWRLVSRFFYDR